MAMAKSGLWDQKSLQAAAWVAGGSLMAGLWGSKQMVIKISVDSCAAMKLTEKYHLVPHVEATYIHHKAWESQNKKVPNMEPDMDSW